MSRRTVSESFDEPRGKPAHARTRGRLEEIPGSAGLVGTSGERLGVRIISIEEQRSLGHVCLCLGLHRVELPKAALRPTVLEIVLSNCGPNTSLHVGGPESQWC